jgi:acetoacetyl-CoA synthetase
MQESKERPLWEPSAERAAAARITAFRRDVERRFAVALPDYAALHVWSVKEPERFWSAVWELCGVIGEPGGVVLEGAGRMPGARFFPEARLSFAENLLRRRGAGEALVFRDEAGRRRALTWDDLHEQVARAARGLAALGVECGDRVAGFLPNAPEAVVAMLAASHLGAIWSSCSPDFGVQGVVDRFGQIEPRVLVAVDGYHYGGRAHETLSRVAEMRHRLPSLERVVVVPHLAESPSPAVVPGAVGWHDLLAGPSPGPLRFQRFPFDHPLYVLYSSGTTGPPKCIVHGAGGTLLQHLKEHRLHVDLRPGDRFFYFTTTGWMMWNWLASGLASEATLVLFDGSPFHPGPSVLWGLAEQERVAVFGTSARYLAAARKEGLRPARSHDLSSLRGVLSTGSPLAPEGFDFVYDAVKRDVCLSSICGGTDIISCFVGGNPAGPVWRGEIQVPGLGMQVDVFDEAGRSLRGSPGELVCTAPFPSMPVGFWNDPDGSRYRAAYFERFPGVWHHGDWVELTAHGGMIVHGRSDATLNPGGVRIGTAEIYRQVETLDEVLESLCIGQDWQGDVRIVLFVRLREGIVLDDALRERIRRRIRENASPRHVPARIVQVADLPRTRSGKLTELAVRDVVHGRPVRNREALANPEALDLFRDLPELREG